MNLGLICYDSARDDDMCSDLSSLARQNAVTLGDNQQ